MVLSEVFLVAKLGRNMVQSISLHYTPNGMSVVKTEPFVGISCHNLFHPNILKKKGT